MTDLTDFLERYNWFAEAIYEVIPEQGENTISSALNVHALLLLISQDPGYRNSSFGNVLGIPDAYLFRAVQRYKDTIAFVNSLNGIFSISNGAFLKENYKLQEHFATLLKTSFYCEPQSVDFSENQSTVQSINAWVEDKTNKRTRDLLDSSMLISETCLALVSATQFNGKWAYPFNAEETARATFYLNENDTIESEMMRMKREVYYKNNEELGVKIIELPYDNNEISLGVVLPNKGEDIKSLERYLFRYNNCINIFEDMIKEEIDVSIPRFKIDRAADFQHILNEIGLTNEFTNEAHLFGMIDRDEFFTFNKIQKKASIEVNEHGTEASSGIIFTSVPNEMDDDEGNNAPSNGVIIYELDVKSDVSNRFAKTLLTCKVRNTNVLAEEATFSVVLPETAFISQFIMEIGGKTYKAEIKEKNDAKIIYNEALVSGRSAGIVESSARDSNEFAVSVNLEPQSAAVFSLTYDEMLQRMQDQYELVLNIRPGQVVENLNVEVNINESRPLKFVRTPTLRSGNEISKNEKYPKPVSDIRRTSEKSAVVKFNPDLKQQKRIARYLGTRVSEGFSGQFIVQYDVERDPQDGEILLQDGYFVHFFAPNDLDPLPKHVVFVLDTSSSMFGRKIIQLKDAMMSILNEIRKQDIISIIEFNSDVAIWDIKSLKSRVLTVDEETDFHDFFPALKEFPLPESTYATDVTIEQAKNVVQQITFGGSTFMIGGLETALYLVKVQLKRNENKKEYYQPIIVFLTDGEPNVGMSSTEEIVETVTQLNFRHNKVPIFSLSFGDGADKEFLRKLSLKNLGFARHIYEASDASLQLQAFYKQISSPLLTDIKFKYESEVKEVTKPHFPIYFRGSELVVSGRCDDSSFPATINGYGSKGPITLKSIIERPVTSLERLWAYLTVKQLLEERNFVDDKTELTKKTVDLSLKYSFVTDVTSLVVVKPKEISTASDSVNAEENEEVTFEGACKKKMIKKRVIKKGKGLIKEYPETITTEEDNQPPPLPEVPKEFLADHPFIIILKYKKDDRNMILFMGRVCKPSY